MFEQKGSGKTALQCAQEANLYEAFYFLAHEKAHHRVLNPPKFG